MSIVVPLKQVGALGECQTPFGKCTGDIDNALVLLDDVFTQLVDKMAPVLREPTPAPPDVNEACKHAVIGAPIEEWADQVQRRIRRVIEKMQDIKERCVV